MCVNYTFEPSTLQIRRGLMVRIVRCVVLISGSEQILCLLLNTKPLYLLQTPPSLCDLEQWLDTEIKPEDKEYMDGEVEAVGCRARGAFGEEVQRGGCREGV
jgi:hypothetical protein